MREKKRTGDIFVEVRFVHCRRDKVASRCWKITGKVERERRGAETSRRRFTAGLSASSSRRRPAPLVASSPFTPCLLFLSLARSPWLLRNPVSFHPLWIRSVSLLILSLPPVFGWPTASHSGLAISALDAR